MASPVAPLAYANEYDLQRGLRRQVSSLLRRAKNPRALAAAPLMDAICAEMGTSDPRAALERIVLTVFAGSDESATILREAVVEADFKRVMSNAELARKSGVSRRHFQRRRAEAVAAIAAYARTIFERSWAEASRMPPMRDSTEVRHFERERAAFLLARDRGNAPEMRAIAGNLLRLSVSAVERSFALECRADANARLGRRDEAMDLLASLSPPARVLIRAKLSLLAGEFADAEEAACMALRHPRDTRERYRCLTVISQARLARSAAWRPPPEVRRLPRDSWERIAMDVEQARHLAREGDWPNAERLARSAQRQTEILGYKELAARAAAVLHATMTARGELARARWWRALAIRRLLPTQDRLLASGLFVPSCREFDVDRLLGSVLYDRLALIVPQMQQDGPEQRGAIRELLGEILRLPLIGPGRSSRFESAVTAVARSDSGFAHYAEKLVGPVHEMLALAQAALTGCTWSSAFESLRDVLVHLSVTVRPAAPRTIPVAMRRSQSTAIDHLRIDDERSAGDADSTETLADLRVRLVSV
jgi:hypothetical protein